MHVAQHLIKHLGLLGSLPLGVKIKYRNLYHALEPAAPERDLLQHSPMRKTEKENM